MTYEDERKQCMIPRCMRMVFKRGLCMVCYGKAKKKVQEGSTTWEQLEEVGLCKSDTDPFDDAYSEAIGE